LSRAADFAHALETRPVRGYQLAVVALVTTALVIDGLDYQLLALVAPLILSEWGISRGDFGIAMAAALFGMAFGAAAGGWLGDRIGRRKALVAAVVLFGIATMAASRADSVAALTALRVAGGWASALPVRMPSRSPPNGCRCGCGPMPSRCWRSGHRQAG